MRARHFVAAFLIIETALFYGAAAHVSAQSAVTITATAQTLCGDGIVQAPEQCDGVNLNGASCSSLGYAGGDLSCASNCVFVADQCTNVTGGGGGGGGGSGGGGGGESESEEIFFGNQTSVILSGKAYPRTTIVVSESGSILTSFSANAEAQFEVTIQIAPGAHAFTMYAVDQNGRRSLNYTFNVAAALNVITSISGIFISPTVDVDKATVRQGDILYISGQTVSRGTILIYVNSENEIVTSTAAGSDGTYSLPFPTGRLEQGLHTVRSKAVALDASESGFSETLSFTVGSQSLLRNPSGDANNDGKVNIVDLSVLLYWWRSSAPQGLATADLNKDAKVDLVDLSIMLFNWTK